MFIYKKKTLSIFRARCKILPRIKKCFIFAFIATYFPIAPHYCRYETEKLGNAGKGQRDELN